MHRRQWLIAAASAVAASRLAAQTGVTRLVVGAAPGGSTDLMAREIAVELRQALGGEFVVENRPGAGGNIAAQVVAQAKPDGTTLLVCYTSHAMNAVLHKDLPFDPVKDFTPLGYLASIPSVLIARPSFAFGTISELLAGHGTLGRPLSIGLPGIGSGGHMAAALLSTKVPPGRITLVPYKGANPAIQDVVAGHVDLAFANLASVTSLIQGGKLKALGVSSTKRVDSLPDVPLVSETVKDFELDSWFGLLGPAGMPRDLVDRYAGAVRKAQASDTFRKRLNGQGFQVGDPGTPARFAEYISAEIERYRHLIAVTGIKTE